MNIVKSIIALTATALVVIAALPYTTGQFCEAFPNSCSDISLLSQKMNTGSSSRTATQNLVGDINEVAIQGRNIDVATLRMIAEEKKRRQRLQQEVRNMKAAQKAAQQAKAAKQQAQWEMQVAYQQQCNKQNSGGGLARAIFTAFNLYKGNLDVVAYTVGDELLLDGKIWNTAWKTLTGNRKSPTCVQVANYLGINESSAPFIQIGYEKRSRF